LGVLLYALVADAVFCSVSIVLLLSIAYLASFAVFHCLPGLLLFLLPNWILLLFSPQP
jgi:hypothetical protein